MQNLLDTINGILWHQYVLFLLLGVGVLFTIWSGFSQYRAITHGVALIRGKYDDKSDPGAINHFQALSAALSATVGLGNIAGVAVAVTLGGPGAVFWMWVVGAVGMALKLTEVTQSMLYRDTSDPDNPHGGPMWVASKGFARWGLKPLGVAIGGIFCITLIISTITGGNMFQAWNVAAITTAYFPSIPQQAVGIIMAVLVGMVIIGGIKRIGAVAGRLVPFMCVLYLLAAVYVLAMRADAIPGVVRLIFTSAFSKADAGGAFLGGTFGYAFLWGMKRALFSNEAGQGSAPIAHSAAKTDEPVREGIVSGLEPFIDTIIVCSLTALVMLSSGAWNREAAARFDPPPSIAASAVQGAWVPSTTALPAKTPEAVRNSKEWRANDALFIVVRGELDTNTGRELHKLTGTVVPGENGKLAIKWDPYKSASPPTIESGDIHLNLVGAALTGYAFDRVTPGLGMWIVTAAAWLFAISTMISWSYYGEQGVIYLLGKWAVFPYKVIYCLLIVVSTLGFMKTDKELDDWTALGTGVMLFANIPIMLIFGRQAMRAYHDYNRRLSSGQVAREAHKAPPITDVMEGKDVN
jgi:AGCS family alanine or glycine:cation symporter